VAIAGGTRIGHLLVEEAETKIGGHIPPIREAGVPQALQEDQDAVVI